MGIKFDDSFLGCFGNLPKRKRTVGVVVHHTCTSTPARTRKSLKDKGCSTHFEVDRDGTIYRYAALDRKCSHVAGQNFQFVGVDLTHPKDGDWPAAQLEAAGALFKWLAEKLEIPMYLYRELPPGFYYHRALGETACPQDFPGEVIFEPDGELL